MPLLKGSAAYTLFIVESTPDGALTPDAFAFRRFVPLTVDGDAEESAGWVLFDKLHDVPGEESPSLTEASFGSRYVIGYREDKWAISKPLIKRETQKRIERMIDAGQVQADEVGRTLRKTVSAAVAKELRQTSRPKSKIVEVMIEPTPISGVALARVFAKGKIAHERIAPLLARTFQADVTHLHPAETAVRRTSAAALATLVPVDFFGGLPAEKPAANEKPAAGRLLYLSPEFLTWLYFAIIDDDGVVVDFDEIARALPVHESPADADAAGLQIAIGKRVKLAGISGPTATLAGAGLDDNGEVLQAVRRGAFVDSLAFDFAIGHRVYSVTLAVDGSRAVKLPDVFPDADDDASASAEKKPKKHPKLPIEDLIDVRVSLLDEVDAVISRLFQEFMRRRIDAAEWRNDVGSIKQAVVDGLAKRAPSNA